jgi:hypothetical protein
MTKLFGESPWGFYACLSVAATSGIVVDHLSVLFDEGTRVPVRDIKNLPPAMRAGKSAVCSDGTAAEWA